MKKTVLFPALLTVCSVISAVVYCNAFAYFNLFLSAVLLFIVLFSRNKDVANRTKLSALWLLILELAAFALLLFGVNVYQPPLVWLVYAVFMVMEICVSPRLSKVQ